MSRFHFHRVFKAATGVTPKAYATALRASRARQQLRESASVTDAMYDAGFNSSGRFYEAAPAMLGMTPTAYRQHGAGVTSASPWRNARWAPCWWRPAPSASARSRYTKTPNTWCAACRNASARPA